MISVQIITKNNEKTLEKTILSLKNQPTEITIADLGSTDKTVEICKNHKINVVSSKSDDLSNVRNLLVSNSKNEWQMFLYPWEIFPENILLEPKENSKFLILRDDLVTKELRLWKKNTAYFKNPVYENLEPDTGKLLNVMVYSVAAELSCDKERLFKWQKDFPTAATPNYYLANYYLAHKKYDDFIRMADHYLFSYKKNDKAVLMLKYYLALVNCYIKRNPNKALSNIMYCIGEMPLMAEFWCLLGDIYLHLKEFDRARIFYKNAIDFGKHRRPDDSMFMELSKYEEYPQKMLGLCYQTTSSSLMTAVT